MISVSAKHESHPYVHLERFEDLLSTVECATGPDNRSTTLTMTFADRQHVTVAEQEWSRRGPLNFITHHHTCNPDIEQREVYRYETAKIQWLNPNLQLTLNRSSFIHFDQNASLAIITTERKEFGFIEASTRLQVHGAPAPAHIARRLRRRGMGGQRSDTERTYSWSFYRKWRTEEMIFQIP